MHQLKDWTMPKAHTYRMTLESPKLLRQTDIILMTSDNVLHNVDCYLLVSYMLRQWGSDNTRIKTLPRVLGIYKVTQYQCGNTYNLQHKVQDILLASVYLIASSWAFPSQLKISKVIPLNTSKERWLIIDLHHRYQSFQRCLRKLYTKDCMVFQTNIIYCMKTVSKKKKKPRVAWSFFNFFFTRN